MLNQCRKDPARSRREGGGTSGAAAWRPREEVALLWSGLGAKLSAGVRKGTSQALNAGRTCGLSSALAARQRRLRLFWGCVITCSPSLCVIPKAAVVCHLCRRDTVRHQCRWRVLNCVVGRLRAFLHHLLTSPSPVIHPPMIPPAGSPKMPENPALEDRLPVELRGGDSRVGRFGPAPQRQLERCCWASGEPQHPPHVARNVRCYRCALSSNSTALTRASRWFQPVQCDAYGYLEPGWGRVGWHCGLTAKEDDKILAQSNTRGEKIREKPDKRTKILKTMTVCHQERGLFAPLAAV